MHWACCPVLMVLSDSLRRLLARARGLLGWLVAAPAVLVGQKAKREHGQDQRDALGDNVRLEDTPHPEVVSAVHNGHNPKGRQGAAHAPAAPEPPHARQDDVPNDVLRWRHQANTTANDKEGGRGWFGLCIGL